MVDDSNRLEGVGKGDRWHDTYVIILRSGGFSMCLILETGRRSVFTPASAHSVTSSRVSHEMDGRMSGALKGKGSKGPRKAAGTGGWMMDGWSSRPFIR